MNNRTCDISKLPVLAIVLSSLLLTGWWSSNPKPEPSPGDSAALQVKCRRLKTENESLKETIKSKDKTIKELEEEIEDQGWKALFYQSVVLIILLAIFCLVYCLLRSRKKPTQERESLTNCPMCNWALDKDAKRCPNDDCRILL